MYSAFLLLYSIAHLTGMLHRLKCILQYWKLYMTLLKCFVALICNLMISIKHLIV